MQAAFRGLVSSSGGGKVPSALLRPRLDTQPYRVTLSSLGQMRRDHEEVFSEGTYTTRTSD